MGFHQRTWIQDISSESKMYPDSVYMYDAGNFIGMLTVKGQNKRWVGFTVISRVQTGEMIEEILESAHEFHVPMRFFSIEKYPAKIESSILWIPGWKIQLQQTQLPHVIEGQPDSQLLRLLPHHQQPQHQELHPPSLPPAQSYPSPSSPSLPKSPSGRQGSSQHSSQNKNNSASKPKALPSSNLISRERQRQSIPKMSGGLPSQSSPSGRTSQLSQSYPISHPSPCPPLPSTPGESNPQPASSFPNRSNSKRHLPSQQVQRQREGKSRHPTFSPQSSHE